MNLIGLGAAQLEQSNNCILAMSVVYTNALEFIWNTQERFGGA